jgi:hypothetical protein
MAVYKKQLFRLWVNYGLPDSAALKDCLKLRFSGQDSLSP